MDITGIINMLFKRNFPNYKVKQIDAHITCMEVPSFIEENIQFLKIFKLKRKIKTDKTRLIFIDLQNEVKFKNDLIKVYYGIDETDKIIYWRY